MRVSAKSDYAVRAMIELTLAAQACTHAPTHVLTCDAIADKQAIPVKFLRNVIMIDLKRAGLVASTRGPEGGYRLARRPQDVTVADIIRAVDGPMASVYGERPQNVQYEGSAEVLRPLWVAVRASLRSVLENVNLADLAKGTLPRKITKLLDDPDAWETH